MYSVASDTVDSGIPAMAPECVNLELPLSVVEVGRNTYHGGGSYPLGSTQVHKPSFILRDVRSSTGWCTRRLTSVEQWTVKDVPLRVVKMADQEGIDLDGMRSRLLPGRCLDHGLRKILNGNWCH